MKSKMLRKVLAKFMIFVRCYKQEIVLMDCLLLYDLTEDVLKLVDSWNYRLSKHLILRQHDHRSLCLRRKSVIVESLFVIATPDMGRTQHCRQQTCRLHVCLRISEFLDQLRGKAQNG